MPRFDFAAGRQWSATSLAPENSGWERSGLYNDRSKRDGQGDYTTVVRHEGPGELSMNAFPFDWEIFLLKGDLEVAGTAMAPGDHCTVLAGEEITGRTASGCEHLIIARSSQ